MLIRHFQNDLIIFLFRMNYNLKMSSTASSSNKTDDKFLKEIHEIRKITAGSIKDFQFNKNRARLLSKNDEISNGKSAIAYWMSRDQRVQDNWGLLFSQDLALTNKLPVHVIFCLTDKFLNAPLRHYKFMLDGLKEVASELEDLNINFHLLRGNHVTEIPKFVNVFNIGCLVCDFGPLKISREWVNGIKEKLPANVPFIQIDSHNVVPFWIASTSEESAATTFRPKIKSKLNEYLTEFPPLIRHPYKAEKPSLKIDWNRSLESLNLDKSVGAVDHCLPSGYRGGIHTLDKFIKFRLNKYEEFRNNPVDEHQSDLSPYFHFGQISAQRANLEVIRRKTPLNAKSVDKFTEQSITRRELADNFVFYNPNYDNLKAIPAWAANTLNDHRNDKREYIYTLKEFEEARTHDNLWNASQVQLTRDGKLHGFLRMYWAKKILEWTKTPDEAFEIAIYLNDRYNIDGRDPNGYYGVMWIFGYHDHPFGERPVIGKLRYMSYNASKGKFDVPAFIRKYSNPTLSSKK